MRDTFEAAIPAAAEEVFPFVSERARMITWFDPSVAKYSFSFEGEARIGDKITIHPFLLPRRWAMTGRLTKLIPNREMIWTLEEGPLSGEEVWILAESDGGCSFSKTLEYEVTGPLRRLLWTAIGRPIFAWATRRELRTLKRLLEGDEKTAVSEGRLELP